MRRQRNIKEKLDESLAHVNHIKSTELLNGKLMSFIKAQCYIFFIRKYTNFLCLHITNYSEFFKDIIYHADHDSLNN